MNTLLLTSCDRIKQTLLALTINSYIIKDPFYVVIADCSSLGLSFDDAIKLDHDDTKITKKNYCSDITLFDKYIKLIPKIKDYKIIHHSPKMNKHHGEANLIKLGLSQVSLINTNESFCLKLNGMSIINYDILSELPLLLENCDIFTFRKTYQEEIASTRIFGCRANILNSLIDKKENYIWMHEPWQFMEIRFDNLLKNYDTNRINHIKKDESDILLDRNYKFEVKLSRESITQFIKNHNIPTENLIIKEFLDGNIYD